MNSTSTASVTLGEEAIEEVDHFTYLASVVDTQGGTAADVKTKIDKARVAFLQLNNIWKFKVISHLKNKIVIFSANVYSVLLDRVETWRTTVTTTKRIQTFVNSCLRRVTFLCLVA